MEEEKDGVSGKEREVFFRWEAYSFYHRKVSLLSIESFSPLWLFSPLPEKFYRVSFAFLKDPPYPLPERRNLQGRIEGKGEWITLNDSFLFKPPRSFLPYPLFLKPYIPPLYLLTPMKPERLHLRLSAGGVVLKEGENGIECLLIRPRGKNHFTLPKGTVEEGESWEETALREVWEETGYRVRIVHPLYPVTYFFYGEERGDRPLAPKKGSWKVRLDKVVLFYLMVVEGWDGPPRAGEEVEEVLFLPYKEAIRKVGFPNMRVVIEEGVSIWEDLFLPSGKGR